MSSVPQQTGTDLRAVAGSPAAAGDLRLRNALTRGWPLIVGFVAVTTLFAWVLTTMQPARYAASSTLTVTPVAAELETTDLLRSIEALERRSIVATFARIPSSIETVRAAARSVGIAPARLEQYRVGGVVVPNTNMIRIEVEGPDAGAAAALANRLAELTNLEARSMYQIYELRPLARAEAPSVRSYPVLGRNLIAGALVGLLGGAAIALLLYKP
ncbi:MAG TPA: hypothetical protein VMT00_06830 [Thermoanaerobaculia bacterium]|nr:hypothetical protein [Thermoanaerobaculia bacterium]